MKANMAFTGERLIPSINKNSGAFYEHLTRYIFASQFVKDKVVLDAGSGSGYGSAILSRNGHAQHVFGIDLSDEAIQYARKEYGSEAVTFQKDKLEKMKTVSDQSIDVLVNFEVIEHLKEQDAFLEQVKRVLKKDGLCIISTPNKLTYPKGNPFHVKELSPKQFSSLLSKYFSHITMLYQSFEMAQLLKQNSPTRFSLEEDFMVVQQDVYTQPIVSEKSQYLVAVCSDAVVPEAKTLAMTTTRVDGHDLSTGLVSLDKEVGDLKNRVSELETLASFQTQEAHQYKFLYEQIISSKTYRAWQFLCRIRKILLQTKS